MNFWTFLDRNLTEGMGLFVLVVLCFVFGSCGNHEGCRIRCGSAEVSTQHQDGGAP